MRDALFVMTVLLLVPVILYRPWLGILAWTVFGLVNPQELTYGMQTFRFALFIGGATLVGMLLTRDRKGIPLTAQTVAMVLLAVWITVTTFAAWVPEIAWDQWEKVIKILLMALVTIVLIDGRKKVTALLVTFVCTLGFFGVKGGIFTILSGGVYRVNGPAEHGYISGNSGIGTALLMILPVMLVMAQRQRRGLARTGIWAAFWLSVVATVFTYSRGALLGLAAVMFLLFFKVRRKALVFLLVVPALLLAYQYVPTQLINRAETIQTFEEDGSAMGRIQAWGVAWNVAKSRFLGAGFGFEALHDRWMSYTFFRDDGNFSVTRAAHSIYFQMLGEHGFVGLGLCLWLLVSTYLLLGRIQRQSAHRPNLQWMSRYAEAMQVGLVGYAVSGAFLSMAYFDLYYAFVALAVSMQRECRTALGARSDAVAKHRYPASDARPLQGASRLPAAQDGIAAPGNRGRP